MTPPVRTALVLDVDTGIDDSLALLYAVASPEAEIIAVTCVGGNVAARQVELNTRAVLELAGRDDVEVALGRETPLRKPVQIAAETHGPRGLGHAEPPPPRRPLSERHAADVIAEAARDRPGEVTLVTLGPLTNLAVALDREPDLPHLLRRWVLMGGAFRAPGNTTPTAEWNIHVDPDAAKACFAAWAEAEEAADAAARPIPKPLAMGLDVTERARFVSGDMVRLAVVAGCTPADAARLAGPGEVRMLPIGSVRVDPIVAFVADALRFYFEFHERYDGFYGAFLHDPFAVAAALDPALVRTLPVHVDVEAGPGLAHGMTVADWRGLTGRPPNVDVAIEGDASGFLDRLVERVGAFAALRAAAGGPATAGAQAGRAAG